MVSSRRRSKKWAPIPTPDVNPFIEAFKYYPRYATIQPVVESLRYTSIISTVQQHIFTELRGKPIHFDSQAEMEAFRDNIKELFSDYRRLEPRKRHLTIVIELVIFILYVIFYIESFPFPPESQSPSNLDRINLTIHDLESLKKTLLDFYPTQMFSPYGFRFESADNYIIVFAAAIHRYIEFHQARSLETNTSIRKLTPNELMEVILAIKTEIIPMLNLQYTLGTASFTHIEADYLKYLNQEFRVGHQCFLETYLYLWFFIVASINIETKRPVQLASIKQHPICNERFGNKYAFLINDCSILLKREESFKMYRSDLLREFRRIYPYYLPNESWNIHSQRTIRIPHVERPNALYALFKHWYNHLRAQSNTDIPSLARQFWSYYFDVTFEGEMGIFVGVQQDFIQTCLTQLAESSLGLFIETEADSGRYQINRNFTVPVQCFAVLFDLPKTDPIPDDFKTYGKDRRTCKQFMMFAGGLIMRGLLMGMELPIKLSYYTLSFLYNPAYKHPSYYILYYGMDLPKKSASILSLFNFDDETLKSVEMNFNHPYPITQLEPDEDERQQPKRKPLPEDKVFRERTPTSPKNPLIRASNVWEFVFRTARYVLTTLNASDPDAIEESERETYKKRRNYQKSLLQAFRKGFYVPLEGIAMDEVTAVHILDKLLHSNTIGISEAAYQDWISQKTTLFRMDAIQPNDPYTQYIHDIQQRVYDIFINDIVCNPKVELPFEDIEGFSELIQGKPDDEIKRTRETFFFRSFLPTLLYFWTSSRTIRPDTLYRVAFAINDPRSSDPAYPTNAQGIKTILGRLPNSHTCFTTLDLPTFNAYFNEEDYSIFERDPEVFNLELHKTAFEDKDAIRKSLLKKLVIALYKNVGFGLAGGRGRPRKPRSRR